MSHDGVEAEDALPESLSRLSHPNTAPGSPKRPDNEVETDVAKLAIPSAAAEPIPDPDQDLKAKETAKASAPSSRPDLEAGPATDTEGQGADSNTSTLIPTDIEHVPVDDDPRLWSPARKWCIVAIISYGALVPTMAGNMFFPAIEDLRRELGATDEDISLSVSLFILAQGLFPLLWSPLSELIGRKPCFVSAMAFFTILSGFTSLAKNMATVIVLRALAAAGSSVTLAIAAGTLADLYEAEERGVKVGVYYAIPISGPALAPIVGGLLTEAAGWRAVFWFLAAAGASSTLAYIFFKETFRTARSAAWQKARAQALQKAEKKHHSHGHGGARASNDHWHGRFHLGRSAKSHPDETGQPDEEAVADSHGPLRAPDYHGPGNEYLYTTASETHVEPPRNSRKGDAGTQANVPSRPATRRASLSRVMSHRSVQAAGRIVTRDGVEVKFKPSLSDVSPLGSASYVLSKPHNLAAVVYSGIAFAAQYSLSYTATNTFTAPPYNYSPILLGCVLLALGVGGMIGSIIGGKISDLRLHQVMKKTGERAEPEERLRTIVIPMILVVPAYVGYGWATQYHTNIAAPIVILVVLGYAQIHSYSVDLSYLVDSNPGRSSGAVAVNSAFRGTLSFIAAEVASPILKAVNNGPFQTGWAVLIALTVIPLFFSMSRGKQWRHDDWRWPRFWRASQWSRDREGGARWIRERERAAAEKTAKA